MQSFKWTKKAQEKLNKQIKNREPKLREQNIDLLYLTIKGEKK